MARKGPSTVMKRRPSTKSKNDYKVNDSNTNIIILVEDDLPINEMLRDFLSMSGYQVHSFLSKSECLENLPLTKPHFILLDMILPECSAQELAIEIEQRTNWSQAETMPICIFMSARKIYEINQSELESPWGEAQFISKPFSLPSLVVILEELTEKA